MIWIWVLLVLVAMVVLATGIFLFFPYWRSPEKRWKNDVLRAHREAKRQFATETAQLKHLDDQCEAERQSLSQQTFRHFLASISVNELEAYPGIGPATIDRLRQAGFHDLARLQTNRIQVQGIGEKRLFDVTNAVGKLIRQAESRFQSGACPESQELKSRLQEILEKYAEIKRRTEARADEVAKAISQMEEPLAIARQVTFWKYFWKDAQEVVPAEWLNNTLPNYQTAIGNERRLDHGDLRTRRPAGNFQSDIKSRKAFVDATPVNDQIPVIGSGAPSNTPPAPANIADRGRKNVPALAQPASHNMRPMSRSSVSQPPMPDPPWSSSRMDFADAMLEITIKFAFAVARIDGRVARKEKALIRQIMVDRYSHDQAIWNRAKAFMAHYETMAIDVEDCIRQVKKEFPTTQRGLLELACQIAGAAGPMNEREIALLERLAREWDIPWARPVGKSAADSPAPAPASQVPLPKLATTPAEPTDPRLLLEIDTSVPLSVELIRRQYNLLTARLAPEKIQGLGGEFEIMAKSKRAAIRVAADALLGQFGEPLQLAAQPIGPAELRPNPDLDAMFGA
jgi:tellurite resistance protein